MKLKLLALCILSSTALSVTADQNQTSLHIESKAEGAYSAFKSGAVDPFETLRQGYSSDLDDTLEGTVRRQKDSELSSENKSSASQIEALKKSMEETKLREKQQAYNSSVTKDGFDYQSFETNYGAILDDKKSTLSDANHGRSSNIESMIGSLNATTAREADYTAANAKTAAENLITILNTEKAEGHSSLASKMEDAKARRDAKISTSENADYLAGIWDDECGSACDMPDIEPPVTEEDNCLYDNDNYIEIYRHDHSEYGMWETNSETEEWYYQGTRIYSYNYSYSNRSNPADEQESESGSKTGFSEGANMLDNTSAGSTTSSEHLKWEICTN